MKLGRSFWTLLTASGSSNLADGVLKTALPLLALALTRDPVLIAGLATAGTLPWLLVALPAGALIDRWDRRTVIVAASMARAVLVALLALSFATGTASIWLLYGAAFAIGVAEVFGDTAAQTILPQIVRPDQLPTANGRLYGVEMTANQFIGPPLAGFLVVAGSALTLGVTGAAWALAAVALLTVPGRFRVERTTSTALRADIRAGLTFLLHHVTLRALAIMTGLFNLASSMVFAVFVLYAVGPNSAMRLSEQQFGLLLTASAVGSVLGSLVAARIERRLGRQWSLTFAVLTGMTGFLGVALTTNPWIVGGLWFVEGIFIMLWNVVVVSLRQTLTPPALLGRVNSAYRLLAWGSMPVGAALGGALASWVGLRWTFAVAAIVVTATLALLPAVRRGRLDERSSI